MKTRTFVVLVALNLLLIGACGFLVYRTADKDSLLSLVRSEPPPRATPAPPPAPEPKPATNAPPAPVVVLQTNAFRWSQVESANYREYIANLRGVGCPEGTIRDIIMADVMRLYAQRRGQAMSPPRLFRFWETEEKRSLTARQAEARDRELAKIDRQLPSVLRELLGINFEREINKYFVETFDDERRLDFLPEAKRAELLAVREQIEALEERAAEDLPAGQKPDAQTLQRIRQQRQELLAAILTPDELEEYELRVSDTAERLRADLVGFNPTEEEFRSIYRLRRGFEDRYAVAAPETDEARAAEQRQLDEQIKTVIPLERVLDYERSKNADYRQLILFSQRYELPTATASTVFDYQQTALAERARVLANKNITDEGRVAALRAIQAETEESVRRALGGDAYLAAYRQNAGAWLQSLGVDPASR